MNGLKGKKLNVTYNNLNKIILWRLRRKLMKETEKSGLQNSMYMIQVLLCIEHWEKN